MEIKLAWGKSLAKSFMKKSKKLLGKDISLNLGGRNRDDTEARKGVVKITEELMVRGLNARQLMLKQKKAHGSGCNITFRE